MRHCYLNIFFTSEFNIYLLHTESGDSFSTLNQVAQFVLHLLWWYFSQTQWVIHCSKLSQVVVYSTFDELSLFHIWWGEFSTFNRVRFFFHIWRGDNFSIFNQLSLLTVGEVSISHSVRWQILQTQSGDSSFSMLVEVQFALHLTA